MLMVKIEQPIKWPFVVKLIMVNCVNAKIYC